jgi:hypothetical protein
VRSRSSLFASLAFVAAVVPAPPRAEAAPVSETPLQQPASSDSGSVNEEPRGAGTCPRTDAVRSELLTVMSEDHMSEGSPVGPPLWPKVEIIDLGPAFRVIANGREREYRDESRDCERRARVAAVFAAVALGLPAAVAPPPAQVLSQAKPGSAQPPIVQIEVGGAVEAGIASTDRALLGGGGLRLVIGRGSLAFAIGISAYAPNTATLGSLGVRQFHVPADVGIRTRSHFGSIDISADLGFAAGALWLRAPDLTSPRSVTIVEFGIRAGAALHYRPASRFAPFLAVQAQLVVNPHSLYAPPRGVVGNAPPIWLGAVAGAAIGL